MQSFFGLTTADVDIRFDGEENRKWVDVKVNRDQRDRFPLYSDGETVSGTVLSCNLFMVNPKFQEHSRNQPLISNSTTLFCEWGFVIS
jgi:vacuolar protein sorting-associated protein 26